VQGRRERPNEATFGGIYYEEQTDKFQTTDNINQSDISYENEDISLNFDHKVLSVQYSDNKSTNVRMLLNKYRMEYQIQPIEN